MVANQQLMMSNFATAMKKLAVVGQDVNALVDCSELIPAPPPLNVAVTFPAGSDASDVQQACTQSPFPSVSAVAPTGSETPIPSNPPAPTSSA